MNWVNFSFGFLIVLFLSFAKSKVISYWVPIEFSIFLIFFVIRSSNIHRALIYTFVLTLSVDMIFQTTHIKGISTMSQLVLVYSVIALKKHVIPSYEDLFLLAFFGMYFMINHYMELGIGLMLGVSGPSIEFPALAFFALFHLMIFAILLNVSNRISRG